MKELLKLLPVLGLISLLSLAIGCTENEDWGDDSPPPKIEDGYDGGGADKQPEGDPGDIKSPDFKGADTDKKGGNTDKKAPKE